MNFSLYLIEFITGFAFLKPRKSRVQLRAEKYAGKTDPLTPEEALEFAQESRIFYRQLMFNSLGAFTCLGVVLASAVAITVGIFAMNALIPYAFGATIGVILIHLVTSIIMRKSHTSLVTLF